MVGAGWGKMAPEHRVQLLGVLSGKGIVSLR